METFDAGDCLRITDEFKDINNAYFDPTEVKITITQSDDGTVVVDEQDMTQSATGRYFYNWQTSVNYAGKNYDVKVVGTKSGVNAIRKEPRMIYLKG